MFLSSFYSFAHKKIQTNKWQRDVGGRDNAIFRKSREYLSIGWESESTKTKCSVVSTTINSTWNNSEATTTTNKKMKRKYLPFACRIVPSPVRRWFFSSAIFVTVVSMTWLTRTKLSWMLRFKILYNGKTKNVFFSLCLLVVFFYCCRFILRCGAVVFCFRCKCDVRWRMQINDQADCVLCKLPKRMSCLVIHLICRHICHSTRVNE